jgi:hypothetical protein
MNVRSPIGVLLMVILVGIALLIRPGWQVWVDALVAGNSSVTVMDMAGATELTVVASTPFCTHPAAWTDYLQYALAGRWPTAPVQATVQVDGRRVGNTPLVGSAIQPGARELLISQSGFTSERFGAESAPLGHLVAGARCLGRTDRS